MRDREEVLDEIRSREEQRRALIRKKGWGEKEGELIGWREDWRWFADADKARC